MQCLNQSIQYVNTLGNNAIEKRQQYVKIGV